MRKVTTLVLGGLAVLLAGEPAAASGCGTRKHPSLESDEARGITFFNETPYRVRLFWSDFDGNLSEYATLEPYTDLSFDTYFGHDWYVEAHTDRGTSECLGPFSANFRANWCDVDILYEDPSDIFDWATTIGCDVAGE